METIDYWKECVSSGAEECGLKLTDEQLQSIAESVECGHEHYGMAYYSPPPSDRINDIEREWKNKIVELERDYEKYRVNAEMAVKRALRQHPKDNVSIGKYGEVFRHGGRTEQIQ